MSKRNVLNAVRQSRSLVLLASTTGGCIASHQNHKANASYKIDSPIESSNIDYCSNKTRWMGSACSWLAIQSGSVALCQEEEASPARYDTAQWRIYTDKARDLVREKDLNGAEKFLVRALDHAVKGFGAQDPHVASAKQNLAELYRLTKEYDKAAPLYDEAVAILMDNYGMKDIRVAFVLHNIAGFYVSQHKLEEAVKYYEQSLQVKLAAVGPGHTETTNTLFHLAEIKWMLGEWDAAIDLARKSIDGLKATGSNMSAYTKRQQRFADMLSEAGKYDEALSVLKEALQQIENSDDVRIKAFILENIGLVELKMENFDRAQESMAMALEIRQEQKHKYPISYTACLRRCSMIELNRFIHHASHHTNKEMTHAPSCLDKAHELSVLATHQATKVMDHMTVDSENDNTSSLPSTADQGHLFDRFKQAASEMMKEVSPSPTHKMLLTAVRPDTVALELAQCLIQEARVLDQMPSHQHSEDKILSLLDQALNLVMSPAHWTHPLPININQQTFQTLTRLDRQRAATLFDILVAYQPLFPDINSNTSGKQEEKKEEEQSNSLLPPRSHTDLQHFHNRYFPSFGGTLHNSRQPPWKSRPKQDHSKKKRS